jgi:hypothetical protein
VLWGTRRTLSRAIERMKIGGERRACLGSTRVAVGMMQAIAWERYAAGMGKALTVLSMATAILGFIIHQAIGIQVGNSSRTHRDSISGTRLQDLHKSWTMKSPYSRSPALCGSTSTYISRVHAVGPLARRCTSFSSRS